jgi:hypothetical protein
MKLALILVSFLLATSAQALTLTGSGCTSNRLCDPVAVDTADEVALYSTPTASTFTVVFNGKNYTGQSNGFGDINAVATAEDNTQIQVAVMFLHWTTTITSGRRAGSVVQHWAITGGSIQ